MIAAPEPSSRAVDQRETILITLAHASPIALHRTDLFRRAARINAAVGLAATDQLTKIGLLSVDAHEVYRLTEAGYKYVERRFERTPMGTNTAFKPIDHAPRLPPRSRELEDLLAKQKAKERLSTAVAILVPLAVVLIFLIFGNR